MLYFRCGPSLKDYDLGQIEEVLRDNYVISIKQAFFTDPALIDYHIINDNNLMTYPDLDSVIRFVSCRFQGTADQVSKLAKWDVFTPIEQDQDFSKALCNTLDFNNYTLDNKYERPLGTGTNGRTCFLSAYHLGFSNLITSRDGIMKSPELQHLIIFYDYALSSQQLINPAVKC